MNSPPSPPAAKLRRPAGPRDSTASSRGSPSRPRALRSSWSSARASPVRASPSGLPSSRPTPPPGRPSRRHLPRSRSRSIGRSSASSPRRFPPRSRRARRHRGHDRARERPGRVPRRGDPCELVITPAAALGPGHYRLYLLGSSPLAGPGGADRLVDDFTIGSPGPASARRSTSARPSRRSATASGSLDLAHDPSGGRPLPGRIAAGPLLEARRRGRRRADRQRAALHAHDLQRAGPGDPEPGRLAPGRSQRSLPLRRPRPGRLLHRRLGTHAICPRAPPPPGGAFRPPGRRRPGRCGRRRSCPPAHLRRPDRGASRPA